jgi:ubiquinone/menaquinone biosynthesis C-methylase UbiE
MHRIGIDYDQGADEYATHRHLHAGVCRELCGQGGLAMGSTVLEVGCGTGNYIRAMSERFDCAASGLDPSAGMLAHAQSFAGRVAWLQGAAEHLPFSTAAFDLIFSVDVIHHVTDRAAFVREVARTLRPGGRVCTVTDSEEIIRRREILSGYFPETVEIELARYPRLEQIAAWASEAGLLCLPTAIVEQPYEIAGSQRFRDRVFSSLHLISETAWRAGLRRLERDLAHGPVQGVLRYACVWAYRDNDPTGRFGDI